MSYGICTSCLHVGRFAEDGLCLDCAVDGKTPAPTVAQNNGKTADRYDGRILDVGALLARPDEPLPWRCEAFAADGYLTVLAGRGGEGKSWLALALACGVARGAEAAGIRCEKGRALIFDAENGQRLIARRLRAAGITGDLDVQPVDAGGLRFAADLPWFRRTIVERRANLVVFDSLRVLSSGVKENDGDALEPIVTALKMLARDTEAAIVLIHHRGKGESEYRGSSVILDQTDLLFTLGRAQGDPEGRSRRKIATAKCRIDEEPAPRWISIDADPGRGLVTVNETEPFEDDGAASRPRDGKRDQVLDLLGGIARPVRNIAKASGLPRTTVQRLLVDLEAEDLAVRQATGWVAHVAQPLGSGPVGHPSNAVLGDEWDAS